jgi:phosphopantothenoylcysteine decarboxylase/phosphopantothenate--cysteine ligase
MHTAALEHGAGCDLFIAAAAVADYRPVRCAEQKIKKQGELITIELTKNPDIVAAVTALATPPAVTIGFAAETEQLEQHARAKLVAKRLTAIVANNVARSDIGFNSDNNEATLYSADSATRFDKRGKSQLARDLIARFAELVEAATRP